MKSTSAKKNWSALVILLIWEVLMAALAIYSEYINRIDFVAFFLIGMLLGLVMLQQSQINKLNEIIKKEK